MINFDDVRLEKELTYLFIANLGVDDIRWCFEKAGIKDYRIISVKQLKTEKPEGVSIPNFVPLVPTLDNSITHPCKNPCVIISHMNEKDLLKKVIDIHLFNDEDLKTKYKQECEQAQLIYKQNYVYTTFDTEQIAEYYIKETLFRKMEAVVDWLNNQTDNSKLIIIEKFENEYVGTGLIKDPKYGKVREYKTNAVYILLEKNPLNLEAGFNLREAFPELIFGDKIPTGKDLRPSMRESETYKKASPAKKAHLLYNANPNNEKSTAHFSKICAQK